jgi:hypothetical protein
MNTESDINNGRKTTRRVLMLRRMQSLEPLRLRGGNGMVGLHLSSGGGLLSMSNACVMVYLFTLSTNRPSTGNRNGRLPMPKSENKCERSLLLSAFATT